MTPPAPLGEVAASAVRHINSDVTTAGRRCATCNSPPRNPLNRGRVTRASLRCSDHGRHPASTDHRGNFARGTIRIPGRGSFLARKSRHHDRSCMHHRTSGHERCSGNNHPMSQAVGLGSLRTGDLTSGVHSNRTVYAGHANSSVRFPRNLWARSDRHRCNPRGDDRYGTRSTHRLSRL